MSNYNDDDLDEAVAEATQAYWIKESKMRRHIESLTAQLDAVTKERDELRATLDMNNRLLVEHLHSLEAGGRNTKLARLNELNTERKDELCALKRQLDKLRLTDTEHSTLCRAAALLDSFDRKSVGDAVIAIVKRLNIDEESETP